MPQFFQSTKFFAVLDVDEARVLFDETPKVLSNHEQAGIGQDYTPGQLLNPLSLIKACCISAWIALWCPLTTNECRHLPKAISLGHLPDDEFVCPHP